MTKQMHDNENGTGHTQTYVAGVDGKPGGYAYTHRLVMEKKLGRKLRANEIVDHIDGNASNNVPSNLRVLSKAQHNKLDPTHREGGRTKGSKNGIRTSVNYNK